MKKLNRLFAILIAVLGVGSLSAQTWTAPVIGQDLKDVNNNTELYMYNVKADAFACSGMSWGTHAIVKELQNGDSKLSADVHNCHVSKPTDGQLQIMLNGKSYLGGDDVNGVNGCWVDNGSANNKYIYKEVSANTNVYTLQLATATEKYLDCSWAYGGHITFNGGYGNTEWAFVLRSDIENGKYLLYKAKKEMYDIYTALKAAGHDGTYAAALSTANAAYTASNATAASVNAATKALFAAVAPALSSKYFAANSLFNNPDMRGFGDDTDWGDGLNAFANGIFESWHSAETITQKQTGLPNGFYTVVFLGMYRQDGGNAAPTLTLTSGSNSVKANLKALTEIDFGVIDGAGKLNDWTENWVSNKPNSTYSAGEALSHTDAGVKVENFVVENGELTITVAMPSTSQWLLCQGFQIYYKAESLDEYANLFYAAKAAAEAFDAEDLNTAAANQISTALFAAATEQANKEWYQARTAELNAAAALANEIKAPYANLASLITLCSEYTDNQNSNANSAEVLATFQTAISTATTEGNAATSVDAINAVYNTLESARQTYARNAVPVYPYAFDMTFLLANPNFDSNIDGWTATSAKRMDAGNIECYDATFTFALANKLTGLGNGTWEVIVDGFYRYGGYDAAEAAHNGGTEVLNAKFYANASEVPLKSIMEGANKANVGATTAGGVRVPNHPNDGDSYFSTGCYKNTVSTLVTDGTLTFGLKKETTQGSDWTLFDNFRLVYKGIDVSELQTNLTALVASANSIKDTKMGNTESTNLIAALDAADASATDADELNEMLSTLQSAYNAAVASIDTYSKVPAYITKANKIDESIAASIQTQYNEGTLEGNAETIFQNLEVATYNHVTTNFKYNVALSDTWNSTGTNTQAATFSNEHWSGETREYKNQQDGDNWGWGAQSWSIDFDQEVTLPAGEYVFKVAGRKSEGTTLELVVTMGETVLGTVNDFPASNNSRGINKLGAASFDPEDPAGFARDGYGFGWQWRYVKFTLAAESTVKVAVHAEANSYNQWVSFGDYTLQMTEETYLEANKHGLDAPTAAAQALVNAVPMGAEEIEVLEEALAMTYTTGAGLLAKIDALNSAVANANAWVSKYSEAKDPLVAALERFEADYNDAQNGALNHMNKGRWATAISMAQAAAVAKDVTNSYAGFETAAKNLNDALDAASTSIGEYNNLKAAIENAEEPDGDDWGSEPFQKPASVKEDINNTRAQAQAAYNAAEVDGEGVTAVIESLNTAIDEVVLNAPAEGQRYYIKVATEGHGKKGNAWFVTLGNAGDNNPTGYGINANNAVKAHLPQAFVFTQVEGNLYNISIQRAEGTVYLTYGELNGSVAGWNKQQIQATTDAEKKGLFEIVPTGKNGVLKILNTIDNSFIDCQDGGSIYTDTDISAEEFAFELATESEITLSIPEKGWATLILPFDAELPEGVKAYSCSEVENGKLTLVEVESLKANTPYLVNGQENDYDFAGYGLADKDSYTDGLFTGTYVEYQTTANSNTYVLQLINGEVGFYLVGEENVQSTVDAYCCYLTYEAQEGEEQAAMFLLSGGQGNDPTAVEGAERKAQSAVVVYDLMGRKVSSMEKGNMYIVNGVKVIIK